MFKHAVACLTCDCDTAACHAAQVRAVVQEDGGNIMFKRWDAGSGTVWVVMEGACAGCTMSKDTLHSGVLRLLQHYVPEVNAVCEEPPAPSSAAALQSETAAATPAQPQPA